MASVDLVFVGPPLLTGDLVFGDDGNPAADAIVTGVAVMPALTAIGAARLGIVATGVAVMPPLTMVSEVRYLSNTQRPLVGKTDVLFQAALPSEAGVEMHHQDAAALSTASRVRYQNASHLDASVQQVWQDALGASNQQHLRFQDGLQIGRQVVARFQDGLERYTGGKVRFQDGVQLGRMDGIRFQDGLRAPNQAAVRFQDALPFFHSVSENEGYGRQLQVGRTSRYQEGLRPPPGVHSGHVEPPGEPCYTPSGDLVFDALWSTDTNLVFVCDVHGGGPVGPGETVVVPVRRIYTVINSATLKRVDGDVLIPTLAMTLTIDVDSWTWGFTARTPGAALPDLQPTGGVPVEVEATINGAAYRAIVEGLSRDRVFARSDLNVTGRGKAAVLDAPYSPLMTFGNTDDRTVQQLANDVLTINGVSIGWDVDTGWQPDDWLVPAGVWSHQGSYITALNAIASAAGAYVQPHPTNKALNVLRRYPVLPWDWGDVTPDFELPSDVVQNEGIVWTDKALYNRVFVRGMKGGRMGQLTRTGTAGDIEAPMVTDALMTDAIGTRQRGIPVLADVGRQAAVSLRLPVLEETGIIMPGKFVRYVDGGVTRIGLVRSTSAEIERADQRLTIWQTIGVETHDSV